ncbi:hypothetical protein KI387_040991, partial [Taxus chinensis]
FVTKAKSRKETKFIPIFLDYSCSIGQDSSSQEEMEQPPKNKAIGSSDLFQESSKR